MKKGKSKYTNEGTLYANVINTALCGGHIFLYLTHISQLLIEKPCETIAGIRLTDSKAYFFVLSYPYFL